MKKSLIIASILLLVGILVACNTMQAGPAGGMPGGGPNGGGPVPSGENAQGQGEPQEVSLPIESKVGIGILKLEDTDLAVDSAKAEELLPLFKALKVLSTDNNTAVDEITALNTQIKNTMTAEQLTAIEDMGFTMQDIRTMMSSYGLTATAGTSSSSSSSNGDRNFGGGGPGGMPGGGMMGGVMSGNTSNSTTQATPNAAAAMTTSRKTAGGYNLTFVDPIIKLLQSKISG